MDRGSRKHDDAFTASPEGLARRHDPLSQLVLILAWSFLLGPFAVMAVLVVFNALQHSFVVGALTSLFVVGLALLWWFHGRTRKHRT